MEIVRDNAAFLSNYEVYTLLTDLQVDKASNKKQNIQQQNLATICYETVKYLEKTPCKFQDPAIVVQFLKKVQQFKLTKAEKLQLLNHRPTSGVEIQLIVEESEERLTEEQIEELLGIIAEILPDPTEAEAQPMEDN